jgi:hypothetical protein
VEPDDGQLAFCRISDLVPGLIAPDLEGRWGTSSGDALYMFVVRPPAIPNRADLGNLAPAHRRDFKMQVNNELADLFGKSEAAFSCATMLRRCEEALHSEFFKLIRFTGQRTLGDIDFFGSLPCGFVVEDEKAKSRSRNIPTHNVNNELTMNLVVLRENTYPYHFFDERNVDHEGTTSTLSRD